VTAERTTGHLDNRLLAALPPAVLRLLAVDLKEKIFKQGVILQEAAIRSTTFISRKPA
jgi:hypothetical protein